MIDTMNKFSIWIWFAVFLASICDDIAYVFFVRRVMGGHKWTAAIISGALTAVTSLEGYAQYAMHPAYIVANSIGSTIGCPMGMFLEDKLPKIKPRDKKTGRFKPAPTVASFQGGDKT